MIITLVQSLGLFSELLPIGCCIIGPLFGYESKAANDALHVSRKTEQHRGIWHFIWLDADQSS